MQRVQIGARCDELRRATRTARMHSRIVLALVVVLAACAGPAPQQGPIVVSTSEAHRTELDAAVGRWVAASGLDVVVADDGQGVPVHFTPQVFRDGAEVCGRSALSSDGERVVALHVATEPRVSCSSRRRSLLHELGHLLTIDYGLDADHPHMAEGAATLMAPVGEVSWIDVDSLIWVCGVAPCTTFVNEQRPR